MKFLYTLNHKKMFVGMTYENHSYVLAFPNLKTVLHTKKLVHPAKHDMFLTKYTYERYPQNPVLHEQEIKRNINGFELNIYASKGYFLHLAKCVSETPGCYITTNPLEDILMYPIFHNVGLVLAFDIMDETKEEIVFSTEIIKPLQDPSLFKLLLP